jgi:hypothetical protein
VRCGADAAHEHVAGRGILQCMDGLTEDADERVLLDEDVSLPRVDGRRLSQRSNGACPHTDAPTPSGGRSNVRLGPNGQCPEVCADVAVRPAWIVLPTPTVALGQLDRGNPP